MEGLNNVNQDTLLDISRSIMNMEASRSELTIKKRGLQAESLELKNKLRVSAGRKLPQRDYAELVTRQNEIQQEVYGIERDVSVFNNQIAQRQQLRMEIQKILNDRKRELKSVVPVSDVKDKLILLRNKYMEFSSDSTRVSSTRIMASRFAEDLDEVIKQF